MCARGQRKYLAGKRRVNVGRETAASCNCFSPFSFALVVAVAMRKYFPCSFARLVISCVYARVCVYTRRESKKRPIEKWAHPTRYVACHATARRALIPQTADHASIRYRRFPEGQFDRIFIFFFLRHAQCAHVRFVYAVKGTG